MVCYRDRVGLVCVVLHMHMEVFHPFVGFCAVCAQVSTILVGNLDMAP